MDTWSSADAIEPDLHSLLLAASMLGDVAQLKRALACGADLACARTVRGEGALTLAAARGSRECVDALIESGASDAKCAAGSTALMAAAARGHVECVRSLLSVSNPRARDADGWTALHYAASDGDSMAVSLLLPFSEPGELDDRGESALGIACRLGRTEAERAIRQYLSVFDERAAIGAAADCCESLGDSKRL